MCHKEGASELKLVSILILTIIAVTHANMRTKKFTLLMVPKSISGSIA